MSAFMSGLVSGFMSTFGAGGGFGDAGAAGAGGVAGSAGADTGASSIAADSANVGSSMASSGAGAPAPSSGGGGPLGGMMGGGGGGGGGMMGGMIPGMGGGSKPAPAPQGGGAAGTVSTNTNVSGTSPANMSSPGMQPDSSGIIRQNPYGQDPTKSPGMTDYLKAAQQGYQKGSDSVKQNQGGVNVPSLQMPGNTYGALFGSATQVGNYGGGQVGVQSPNLMSGSAGQASLAPPPAAPPPAIPQAAPIAMAPPAPPQPPPMAVSDQLAKKNIRIANKDMDVFLQRVYSNITKGKK